MNLSLSRRKKIQNKLSAWYRLYQRRLPWRATKDPYKIWVSEIMLQQTQVTTVIPYYQRWLQNFPNLKSLAAAPLHKVLRLWEGLGYYRRARMLHEAAGFICKNLHGKIPETAAALQKLPGIGRYSAGAIASIAFGEKVPVLDGNVMRILTRIFAIPKSIDSAMAKEDLWERVENLLPDGNPGDFNQALMELGATVCFPTDPQCLQCPVKTLCLAHAKGQETTFPVRSKKELTQKIKQVALVQQDQKKQVWISKQPEEGRWGGLWVFPFWENKKNMLAAIPQKKPNLVRLLTLRHSFTKYRISLEVYCLKLPIHSMIGRWKNGGRWIVLSKLKKFAFPAPHRQIAEKLLS